MRATVLPITDSFFTHKKPAPPPPEPASRARTIHRDLAGKRYGQWTAIAACRTPEGVHAHLCRCDCGYERLVRNWYMVHRLSKCRGHKHSNAKPRTNPYRNVPTYSHDGKTLTMSGWAREVGLPLSTISARLKSGWPIGRAVSEGVLRA